MTSAFRIRTRAGNVEFDDGMPAHAGIPLTSRDAESNSVSGAVERKQAA